MKDEPMPRESHHLERAQRALKWSIVFAAVAMLFLLGAFVQHNYLEPGPWDPLGDYPMQVVMNDQRVIDPGETVWIRAVKCVDSSKPVVVEGHSQWQSVLPPGTIVPNGNGTATRYPAGVRAPKLHGINQPQPDKNGCTTYEYENVLPDIVFDRAAEVCKATGHSSLWRLTGAETPVRDGEEGVTRAWESQAFRIGCLGDTGGQ
jgi:hypothetical protein